MSIMKISEICGDVNTLLKFSFLLLPVKICTWSVFFCFLKTGEILSLFSNHFWYVNYKNSKNFSFCMFAVSDLVHWRTRLKLAFTKNLFPYHRICFSPCLSVFHKVSISSCLKSSHCFAWLWSRHAHSDHDSLNYIQRYGNKEGFFLPDILSII